MKNSEKNYSDNGAVLFNVVETYGQSLNAARKNSNETSAWSNQSRKNNVKNALFFFVAIGCAVVLFSKKLNQPEIQKSRNAA